MSASGHHREISDGGAAPSAAWIVRLEQLIFGHRRAVLVLFLLATAFMVWSASRLKIDAGFTKLLPAKHHTCRPIWSMPRNSAARTGS